VFVKSSINWTFRTQVSGWDEQVKEAAGLLCLVYRQRQDEQGFLPYHSLRLELGKVGRIVGLWDMLVDPRHYQRHLIVKWHDEQCQAECQKCTLQVWGSSPLLQGLYLLQSRGTREEQVRGIDLQVRNHPKIAPTKDASLLSLAEMSLAVLRRAVVVLGMVSQMEQVNAEGVEWIVFPRTTREPEEFVQCYECTLGETVNRPVSSDLAAQMVTHGVQCLCANREWKYEEYGAFQFSSCEHVPNGRKVHILGSGEPAKVEKSFRRPDQG